MLPCRRRAINALRAQEAEKVKLREISQRCAALPDIDKRTPDEILGFQSKDIFVGRPIDEGYADMSLSYTSVVTPKEPVKITAKKSRKKK